MLNIGASYSTLSSAELLRNAVSQYCVGNPISCEFWHRGLNDSYKVKSKGESYILRVYRKEWRGRSQIDFEINALNYLHDRGAKVSYPIKRLDGEYVTELNTPEGLRYAIVTSFAEGEPLSYDDVQDAHLYGASVADIHSLSEGFSTEHSRFELDHIHLLVEPLECIRPLLSHRPEWWTFMENFGDRLLDIITNTDQEETDYGLCHGDFHGWNAHKYSNNITFFDFDCCGYGWRAYDIAVFRWGARLRDKETERWEAFVKGYETKRQISDVDLKLTTAFLAIRDIWLMGVYVDIAKDFGRGPLDSAYIDGRVKFLKSIEAEHFA